MRLVHAWASSVFQEEDRKYLASNVLNDDPGYWCSIGEHSSNEEVTLEVELEKVTRVSHLFIKWAFSPLMFAVDI